jgi:hypothetical protein
VHLFQGRDGDLLPGVGRRRAHGGVGAPSGLCPLWLCCREKW